MKPLVLACALAGLLAAQQFKLELDHLAAKASDSVDLSLSSSLLQLGAAFLDSKDPDQATVKKVVAGLEGIYIRHFEFRKDGQYTQADVDLVRSQLKAPEWSRMVGVKSAEEGENLEVWMRTNEGKVNGVAILATDPKSLTVVNLVGKVDLESLAALGGHFSIPKIDTSPKMLKNLKKK